jgi:hypothetical protein
MVSRRRLAGILAIVLLIMTGCSSPTLDQYAAKANAKCNEIEALGFGLDVDPSIQMEQSQSLHEGLHNWKKLLPYLKKLRRPTDYKPELAALYEASDRLTVLTEQVVADLDTGNPSASLDAASAVFDEVRSRFHGLGMTSCPTGDATENYLGDPLGSSAQTSEEPTPTPTVDVAQVMLDALPTPDASSTTGLQPAQDPQLIDPGYQGQDKATSNYYTSDFLPPTCSYGPGGLNQWDDNWRVDYSNYAFSSGTFVLNGQPVAHGTIKLVALKPETIDQAKAFFAQPQQCKTQDGYDTIYYVPETATVLGGDVPTQFDRRVNDGSKQTDEAIMAQTISGNYLLQVTAVIDDRNSEFGPQKESYRAVLGQLLSGIDSQIGTHFAV